MPHLKTHNPVTVVIDAARSRTAEVSVQWLLENRPAMDGWPAITDAPPITYGNRLDFLICGEEGFRAIARDLREAKATADIICWGFDPGMELEREGRGNTWQRRAAYGELLNEITTRADNPVRVRLLVWHDWLASVKQNNLPGYTDAVRGPLASPYDHPARHEYCVRWWRDNLMASTAGAGGKNPNLQVVLRSIDEADVRKLLAAEPPEEDQPVSRRFNPVDEADLLLDYATHHQKPILIDYAYDDGRKAVGYVMGLNSVTDFWDRTAHDIDDPLRDTWLKSKTSKELKHERRTQRTASQVAYRHTKPYQDYACRVVGPALERLHQNFERGWNLFAPGALQTKELTALPPRIPTLPKNPAHAVQIVRTQPHEGEKSIKALYFQATSYARNYLYIENQYFFYPEFARHLKKERKDFCDAWARVSGKPLAEMPKLHLFIVIPHPEDDGLVPRTFDTLSELGASSTMPAQAKLVDDGKVDQDYANARPGRKGNQVLDRPSLQQLHDSLGLKVSVARLRTGGVVGGQMAYREIYIHSKLMLIDDVFVTLGSANLNQRSMSVDSEINLAATGLPWAAELRKRVFELHSGGKYQRDRRLAQGAGGFQKMGKANDQNRDIQIAGNANMKGFLLPFEDHRATTTMHASVTVPSSGNAAMV